MKACYRYILTSSPGGAPQIWSSCCRSVRSVPNSDMDCIVDLLKVREQHLYGKRIRDLKLICAVSSPPPAPHNHQVNNIISLLSISYKLHCNCN
ncbi:hypothetical protein HU200_016732 [Digitaria exilis]|uniref:Uncharacterized protein n=1 Tax=Digitaria exilis TaxID=1010633 RepID=A0A835F7M7_9POAL|nr:hypothetical protein HU200_016732 [Digitaria exilis]